MSIAENKIKVVLFSGGSGSDVLSREFLGHPGVALTLAVNGYDDGASTGELRRFFGDMLGPSDFRKNAARMARALGTLPDSGIDLLELRLPAPCTREEALGCLQAVRELSLPAGSEFQRHVQSLATALDPEPRTAIAAALDAFERHFNDAGRPFEWSNCSIGNLALAGCFLQANRTFNRAIARYCALLSLPSGLIENVTTGTNAYLVATDLDGGFITSEAAMVDGSRRNYIDDIFLIKCALADDADLAGVAAEDFFAGCAVELAPNPELLAKISSADLIVYAPGTQHSSLYPSYMTPGIGAAIADNLTAIKVLITNIQEDAEIPDNSAVDLIEKAVYYLREKDRIAHPLPCLITHYLLNDPGRQSEESAYIPLGRLENIEDPRLVRIGAYEEGATGCHNAKKVLTPFIETILTSRRPKKVAVLLLNTRSLNKVSQSLLELMRAGSDRLLPQVSVFYSSPDELAPRFVARLPMAIHRLGAEEDFADPAFVRSLGERAFDYVVLFDSSGSYKGEDIFNLVSLLSNTRLDSVWGSRRLSVRDIHQSYKGRYGHRMLLGTISYLGSHLLSLAYLALYGRHISDTLTGVRAVKISYFTENYTQLDHPRINHYLLSALLRAQATVFETPVQFFPQYPEGAVTVGEGLRALLTILWWRFKTLLRPVPDERG